MIFTLELQFFVTKGDRIYYDQIDDQTLRRPDGRPDHSRRPDRWPDSHRDQNVKIRSPIWSPGAIWSPIWSSDEACFSSHLFKRPLIFAQKAQLQSKSCLHFGHLDRSGCPGAIWSPRSHLVAHQVAGAVGCQSGRGRCIQLQLKFWFGRNHPSWQPIKIPSIFVAF